MPLVVLPARVICFRLCFLKIDGMEPANARASEMRAVADRRHQCRRSGSRPQRLPPATPAIHERCAPSRREISPEGVLSRAPLQARRRRHPFLSLDTHTALCRIILAEGRARARRIRRSAAGSSSAELLMKPRAYRFTIKATIAACALIRAMPLLIAGRRRDGLSDSA